MINRSFIIKLCKMKDQELKSFLYQTLKNNNYTPILKEDYIIAEGSLPICLIAHIDTVFSYLPKEFYYDQEKFMLWSPDGAGFDDRIGIYIILKLIEKGFYPSIIFTTGEEVGGIGSNKIISDYSDCPFKDCRALIQLDRANRNDSVYYYCDNKDFEKFINKYGFKTNYGTFTDISILAPAWKIAAVNLSVGYIDEHTHMERVFLNWTEETINKMEKILKDSIKIPSYTYIPMNTSLNINNISPIEDDISSCLFCGRSFSKKIHKNIITYPDFTYAVCDDCKELYLC